MNNKITNNPFVPFFLKRKNIIKINKGRKVNLSVIETHRGSQDLFPRLLRKISSSVSICFILSSIMDLAIS